MSYFVDLFGHRVENYVRHMLNGRRPARVVVCMIYFLDVHGRGSWADCFLASMCYDCAPSRLQSAIRRVFELATKRIRIPGVEVIALPLFEALDGSDTRDYVQRVEPSPKAVAKSPSCCSTPSTEAALSALRMATTAVERNGHWFECSEDDHRHDWA